MHACFQLVSQSVIVLIAMNMDSARLLGIVSMNASTHLHRHALVFRQHPSIHRRSSWLALVQVGLFFWVLFHLFFFVYYLIGSPYEGFFPVCIEEGEEGRRNR